MTTVLNIPRWNAIYRQFRTALYQKQMLAAGNWLKSQLQPFISLDIGSNQLVQFYINFYTQIYEASKFQNLVPGDDIRQTWYSPD